MSLSSAVMVLGYCEFRAASGHFPQPQGGRLSVVRKVDQFVEGSRVKRRKGMTPDYITWTARLNHA